MGHPNGNRPAIGLRTCLQGRLLPPLRIGAVARAIEVAALLIVSLAYSRPSMGRDLAVSESKAKWIK